MKHALFLILIAFIFTACRDDAVSPDERDGNLIPNSSFEFSGSPSLRQWNVSGPVEFYRDTPPDGGSYSIGIDESWIEFNSVSYALETLQGNKIYTLTCWAKAGGIPGTIQFELHTDTLVYTRIAEVKDSVWRPYTITDTIDGSRGDTIKIYLKGGISQLLPSTTYYDRCVLFAR